MALASEVIDLISDSEDDVSPSKAAVSTLQAFVPRKEKTISANQFKDKRDAPLASAPQQQPFANIVPKPHVSNTPRPQANVTTKPKADVAPKPQTNIIPRPQANATPRPQAHVVTPNTVHDWTNIRPNASISEILSHGLQNVARRAGMHPQQQSPGATAFAQPNGLDRNDARHLQRQQQAPRVRESPRTQFVQYRPTPADPVEPRGAGGADERTHEERQRRFVEYHKKESERKGEIPTAQSIVPAVDNSAGVVPAFKARDSTAAQGIIASSRLPGVDYQAPSWQKQSPQRQEPEAKRRKYEHREEADDAAGMVEARRLSAAAIRQESDSASHKQSPAEVDPRGIASNTLQPSNLDVNANTVLPSLKGVKSSRQAPVAATILQEIGGTEESRRDDAESSFVASKPPAPKEYVLNKDKPILLDESSDSDSPDEIPAKPMRRRPDTRKPETMPPSATYQATKSATSVTPKAGSTLTNDLQTTTLEQVDVDIVRSKQSLAQANQVPATQGGSNHGTPYSIEEDNLLAQLREAGTGWDEIINHFSGRTRGSLQVRYSTKLKHRKSVPLKPQSSGVQKPAIRRAERSEEKRQVHRPDAETPTDYVAPSRRNLKVAPRNDGFVSWAEIKAMKSEKEENAAENSATPVPAQEAFMQTPGLGLDFAYPASVSRILRARELGNTARRNWSSNSRLDVSDELQNHVLDTLGPRRYFHGASRDVTCVAWADDGNRFAAGAIAIDDERSMQYNRPNNLLLGDLEKNSLQELPEHHVPRPAVSDIRNVNSLRTMQETQDPRLFKTVAAVGFSEDSSKLYSAGSDGVVRMYDASSGGCLSSINHEAEVALLTTNSNGLLASGSHRPDDSSISVIHGYNDRLETVARFGPSRADVESSLPIFPSALKWGAGIYSHLLLAGFASDSYDDDRLAAGEILLWDASADRKINLPTARNVFDVAWNPFPSSGSSLFAVAGARHGRHYRSSIQCFAPNQGRASRVLIWDCPAFDINDLVYCPHDDNLIAAGATDGKVYIWDKRGANRSQAPLHVLSHDQTKNVLDHDRDVEIADTGVRFLSWSATGNRLYSGSSDGTVKVWNPYRAPQDVHVKDVTTFNSAVMSGAFSPDYRDLLIGEDAGQVNLLSVDRERRSVRATKKFEYFPAPAPIVNDDKYAAARELLATDQVQIRPMGNLPVRQAVQGPEYKGPFLAPSDDFVAQLDTQHQLALQKQSDLRTSLFGRQSDQDTEKAMDEADRQVLMCKQALEVAQQKWSDHKKLEPAALLLQKTFRDTQPTAIKGLADQLTKNCSLDCNYLPAAGDEDGEAPDNHRSEQRIPGKLRSLHRAIDTADMTNAEIQEAGLTGKCSACRGPAPKSKRGLPICEQCSLARAGLTARCEKCAAPVRPNLDERINQTICERCNFHCFRCGGIAIVSPTCDNITCEPCGTQWEAGVLGYEVVGSRSSSRLVKDWSHEQDMESLDDRMGRMFGEDGMERLAGGWK